MKKILYLLMVAIILISTAACKKTTTAPYYPTDGLVSYFSLDGNLKDAEGNTPDGTNNGSATFTTGKSGSAITLNGTDQYIDFNRKTYKNGNNLSISLWFKKSSNATLQYFVLCNDFGVFTNNGYIGLFIGTSGGNNAEGTFTYDTWTHFVGTFDGTDIKAYINGVLVETTNNPGDITGSDRFLVFGKLLTYYWAGSIDELFIYNKTLSQSEVTQLYNM